MNVGTILCRLLWGDLEECDIDEDEQRFLYDGVAPHTGNITIDL